MTRIMIYDEDEKRIDEFCEQHDLTNAELIELLLDNYLEDLGEAL